MDLAQLQASMMRNQQASGKLAGLDEKYKRATAQVDAAPTAPNQYGQTSVLNVIGDVMGQSRGRKQMRELAPQREQARADIAQGESDMAGNKLKLAMAKEERDATYAQERTEAHALKQATNAQDAETWSNGKDSIPVVYNAQRQPVQLDGSPVPEGFTPKERTYGLGSSGGRGKAYTRKDQQEVSESISSVANTRQIVGNFDESYAQPTGLPTGFANNLAMAASREDILGLVSPDMDATTKAAAQWWADWRMFYTLPKRNAAFGATLTSNEQAAWREAENIVPGMPADQIAIRVARLQEVAETALARTANMAMNDPLESNRGYWKSGMQGVMDYDEGTNQFTSLGAVDTSAVPEGMSPEEWADVSAEDRKYFLENMQ